MSPFTLSIKAFGGLNGGSDFSLQFEQLHNMILPQCQQVIRRFKVGLVWFTGGLVKVQS